MGLPEIESLSCTPGSGMRRLRSTQNQVFNAILFLYRHVKKKKELLSDKDRSSSCAHTGVPYVNESYEQKGLTLK